MALWVGGTSGEEEPWERITTQPLLAYLFRFLTKTPPTLKYYLLITGRGKGIKLDAAKQNEWEVQDYWHCRVHHIQLLFKTLQMKFCNNRTAMISLNSTFLNRENKKWILGHIENIRNLDVEKQQFKSLCLVRIFFSLSTLHWSTWRMNFLFITESWKTMDHFP